MGLPYEREKTKGLRGTLRHCPGMGIKKPGDVSPRKNQLEANGGIVQFIGNYLYAVNHHRKSKGELDDG